MRSLIGLVVLGVLCFGCVDGRAGARDAGYYRFIDASSATRVIPNDAGSAPDMGLAMMGTAGSFGGMPVPTDGGGTCFSCGVSCVNCGGTCLCQTGTNPQPLPWDPPFEHTGPAGWKDSSLPLCSGLEQISGLDVWSDARGVFALVSGTGLPTSAPRASIQNDDDGGAVPAEGSTTIGMDAGGLLVTFVQRTDIWSNDGSGWKLSVDAPNVGGAFGLTGMPRSSLLIHDPSSLVDPTASPPPGQMPGGFLQGVTMGTKIGCSLGVGNGNALDCFDVDPIQSVFAVRDRLAYAVMGGTRLLSYDGTRWHPNPALIPYPIAALWADQDNVLGVGRSGTVLWLKQGAWALQDPGTFEHFTSVWASAGDDVWAGTAQGNIFHYDGKSWTKSGHLGGVTCTTTTPVSGIWGAGGSVFFHNDTEVARWDGTTLESLGNWACSSGSAMSALRITGLWGNSAQEVFISLLDASREGMGGCGAALFAYFDGNAFHRI